MSHLHNLFSVRNNPNKGDVDFDMLPFRINSCIKE